MIKGLDFRDERVNFVQIGLGTNSTFIQNLTVNKWSDTWSNSIDWLLSGSSQRCWRNITGVALEPVAEHVEALCEAVMLLPGVDLVQAAVGDRDIWNEDMQVFAPGARDDLLKKVPEIQRESLANDLEYILNMSCVGKNPHPGIPQQRQHIFEKYGVVVDIEHRQADVWTWSTLSRTCNFHSCEILLVDTEGCDTQILRSLIWHCSYYADWGDNSVWPWIIQFETMGICDELEGTNSEWEIICELQRCGYNLVHYSHHNTYMIWQEALGKEKTLMNWMASWEGEECSTISRNCTSGSSKDNHALARSPQPKMKRPKKRQPLEPRDDLPQCIRCRKFSVGWCSKCKGYICEPCAPYHLPCYAWKIGEVAASRQCVDTMDRGRALRHGVRRTPGEGQTREVLERIIPWCGAKRQGRGALRHDRKGEKAARSRARFRGVVA